MTREEAVDYLKWIRPKNPYTQDKKNVQTAIDMAVEALQNVEVKRTKVDLVRIHVAESVQMDFISENAWDDIYPIIKEELARKIGMQMLSDNLIEFAPMPDFPTGNGCTKNIEAFVRVAKKGWL